MSSAWEMERVEGRTFQKEGAFCEKAQKGESLCSANFRQLSSSLELLEQRGSAWSQAGFVRQGAKV